MTASQIAVALQILAPGANYAVQGYPDGTYVIVWNDVNVSRPTEAQMQAAFDAYVPPPSLSDQIQALRDQIAKLQGM